MNKKLALFVIAALMMGAVFAAPVTTDMARRVAVNFWNS